MKPEADLDMIMAATTGATEADLKTYIKVLITEVRALRNGTVTYEETTDPDEGPGQRSFKPVFEPGFKQLKEDLAAHKELLAKFKYNAQLVIEHATGSNKPIDQYESMAQIWATIDQHEVNFAHEYGEMFREQIKEALLYPMEDAGLITDPLAKEVALRLNNETGTILELYEKLAEAKKEGVISMVIESDPAANGLIDRLLAKARSKVFKKINR